MGLAQAIAEEVAQEMFIRASQVHEKFDPQRAAMGLIDLIHLTLLLQRKWLLSYQNEAAMAHCIVVPWQCR